MAQRKLDSLASKQASKVTTALSNAGRRFKYILCCWQASRLEELQLKEQQRMKDFVAAMGLADKLGDRFQ